MTAQGWLAVAGALVLLSGPAPAAKRVGALAGQGRLGAARAGPAARRVRRLPGPALAGAGVVGALAGVVIAGGVPLAVAAAAVCGAGWRVSRDVVRRRAAASRHAQLLTSLRVLIGELEVGARPSAALTAAAQAAPAHETVFGTAATAAADTGEAGTVLTADPDTRAIGLAWRLGEDTGVELAAVLSRVALDLAAQDEQRRSVAIALAGPRASAALLTGLPLLGIALGAAMGARPWAFLFGSGAGRIVCCVGVLLDVAGVLWMRRILRRAERA